MAEARFDWDAKKDLNNQARHGVSFIEAQHAFEDPRRVIAEDLSHSTKEKRYYCFGRVSGGVLTVRFTYRGGIIRIFGAGFWARARISMSRRIKYTNEPLGKLRVISDFLPRPEALAFREEGVKVTIALSKYSVDFFKREAQKHGTRYQRMIRRLLDSYAQAHSQDSAVLAGQRRRTKVRSL